MEYLFTIYPLAFAKERYLVADAELDVLTDVQVCLGKRLQIEIVPDTVLQTESDVVPSLLASRTIRLIKQRKPVIVAVSDVVVIEIMA